MDSASISFLFVRIQDYLNASAHNRCSRDTVPRTIFIKALVSLFINTRLDFYCLWLLCLGSTGTGTQIITYFLWHNNNTRATKSQALFSDIRPDHKSDSTADALGCADIVGGTVFVELAHKVVVHGSMDLIGLSVGFAAALAAIRSLLRS